MKEFAVDFSDFQRLNVMMLMINKCQLCKSIYAFLHNLFLIICLFSVSVITLNFLKSR